MTEHEWLASIDPVALLDDLGDKAAPRKLRLFGCASCRRHWAQMSNREARTALETAEAFAEGRSSEDDLLEASEAVEPAIYEESYFHQPLFFAAAQAANPDISQSIYELLQSLETLAVREALYGCIPGEDEASIRESAIENERREQARLIREVFGNPYRAPELDPVWVFGNDALVRNLATVMAEERRFEELPILADALDEAGCTNIRLLEHLRLTQHQSSQETRRAPTHVPGCWALDLLAHAERVPAK